MKNYLVLICTILLSGILIAQNSNELQVTYIANEGFLVASGDQHVLIDAIFKAEFNWCVTPSDEVLAKIINSDDPFDDVDLTLFSHHHVDHFSAPLTIEYLKEDSDRKALVTWQALNMMGNESDFKLVVEQVKEITPKQGRVEKFTHNGIEISVLGARHSPYFEDDGSNRHEKVQQNGYLIKMNGRTVLHLGDASVGFMRDIVENFNLDEIMIDVMFYQCDARPESIDFIQNVIQPKVIVAMHLIPERFEMMETFFKQAYPQAVIFKSLMDKKQF